ncbi:MAG TPA: flagellin [Terriglobia bacterium]|nr:flagellin [Terriglobia bacterium]
MSISLLNNITSLEAENQLNQTNASLQNTLVQLSSGSRLNSGADDPAGLSIADSLQANITQLNQASNNANTGIGLLQTADGSLGQVTHLLDRAITIATEAANGGLTTSQAAALDNEFTSIKAEIDRIGSQTTFNSTNVFTGSTTSIFLGSAANSIGINISTLSSTALNLSSDSLTSTTNAAQALTDINAAVSTVAQDRGTIGATLNRLTDAQNVIANQVTNLTSAQNLIRSANIPQDVSQEAQYSVLEQTGISALTQANQSTQSILKLFQ